MSVLRNLTRRIEQGELEYYNFYNVIDPEISLSTIYYAKYEHDTIDVEQSLTIAYFDIEVYVPEENRWPDPKKDPICSIGLVCNDTIRVYGLVNSREEVDTEAIKNTIKEVAGNTLNLDLDNITLASFLDEKELLKQFWEDLRKLDPCLIAGWNIDKFDVPYMMERLKVLFGDQWQSIVSRFGYVIERKTENGVYYDIPEFGRYDVMYFYKPRDEGGLNYGEKEPSYALDYIAKNKLGLGKLEYEGSIHEFYRKDKNRFFAYNLLDVLLVSELDRRLEPVKLHNILRRMLGCEYESTLSGISKMYEGFVYKTLGNTKVRFGYLQETEFSTQNLDRTETRREIKSYFGAYVREPKAGLYTGELLMDLDASRLYPSMIMQFNISFDTLYGLIIDPRCYKAMEALKDMMNEKTSDKRRKKSDKIKKALIRLYEELHGVRVKNGESKHTKEGRRFVEVVDTLLDRLCDSGLLWNEVISPTTARGYVYLRRYLISFIEIVKRLKMEQTGKEYNVFAYDYVFKGETDIDSIYVLVNINSKPWKIVKWTVKELEDRLNKDLILSCYGTLFLKHQVKKGLFFELLDKLGRMRKEYEKMAEETDDPLMKNKYKKNAKTCKVVMNTVYGLYGLPTFQFSNPWLASSITLQGRISIKMAHWITEQVIRDRLWKNEVEKEVGKIE